jgi:selenocysteine-specific elongation factor
MHVIATAGHVDHGKSTLVRALTGMEPDRWAEERRRGMTIDLGFAWTDLPSGQQIAFVDVPGHERFLTNMLAGVGPAPAMMFVVAADEGWKPQSQEHLDALAAFGVRDVLLVLTKSDLAEPAPALQDARAEFAAVGMHDVAAVAVSGKTGAGLDELTDALDKLVAGLPQPDASAPVRFWIDRAFTIRGAGTVVTGTLGAGTVAVGDQLLLAPSMRPVVVRRIESCKEQWDVVEGTARVALNLRGLDLHDVARGMALVTPGAWAMTDEIDAVVAADATPRHVTAHLGSAAVPTRLRRLGPNAIRATLDEPLPLRNGDVLLLRAPASRAMWRATVADIDPQTTRRRDGDDRTMRPQPPPRPAEPTPAARSLGAVLAADPFASPSADDLQAAGVTPTDVGLAVRAGIALRISSSVVVAPDAPDRAVAILSGLPQPFTVSEAGRALGTTRRVTVPLLEHLDSRRLTRRLDDGKRTVTHLSA